MTVDSLHASFEQIDQRVRHMIEKGCTNAALEACIRRLWSQQFHQELSKPALQGMITHYRALYKTQKTRKVQKGGMAPLDYAGGQGTSEVYGRFPVWEGSSPQYVNDLGLINRTCESSIGPGCTRQQGGRYSRKQRGGSIYDTVGSFLGGGGIGAAMRNGYAPASVPANSLQQITGAIQARPVPGNGDPTVPQWSTTSFTPKPYDSASQTTFHLSPVYTGY
jgi:hypothetical protein